MMSIPDLFRCPISLDLFADPVTLSTGQTYDRPFIEKWLADGNLTCPVTMQRLEDTSLVPNHTLRHFIGWWLLAGPAANSQRRKSIDLGQFSFSALKRNLQSPEVDTETKLESLKKIRTLLVESDVGQTYLTQLGFFPLLLQFLLQSPLIVNAEDLAELGLECILRLLPSADLNSVNIIKNETNLGQLVLLLEQGNTNVQTGLCSLIESIALPVKNRELCLLMGQSHRLLQVLVSLLYQTISDAAVRAISAICTVEANRETVVKAGGVDGLICYLSGSGGGNSSRALATLEALLQSEIGKKAALKNSGAIVVLVKNVFRVSSNLEGSECAIGSLLAVCGSSAWARAEAVSSGVVTQLLLLIQSQCSAEAKARARVLLKLFRFLWAEDE